MRRKRDALTFVCANGQAQIESVLLFSAFQSPTEVAVATLSINISLLRSG